MELNPNGIVGIRVFVPLADIPVWKKARGVISHANDGPEIFLRRSIPANGKQLPFEEPWRSLRIIDFNEPLGSIDLKVPVVPHGFGEGSMLFIPVLGPDVLRVTEQRVLEHLNRAQLPLNAPTKESDKDPDAPSDKPDHPVTIDAFKPGNPNSSNTIGVYEGGGHHATGVYRPAGDCKMRSYGAKDEGTFCFVCKWLIVSRLDPAMHGELDKTYPKGTTYPKVGP